MPATRHDLLLEWASERGSGSWEQFRRAHEWLFPAQTRPAWMTPGFTSRMLATLGHLEIDWQARRWSAAPPVLTLLPSAGAHALLTGGRTRALTDTLEAALEEHQDLYGLPPHPQELAPSAVMIACEDETHGEQLAAELGIRYEYSVSERLSEMLPALDDYLALTTSTPAAKGYGVASFNVQSLSWEDAESDARPGLYRYDVYGAPVFRLVDRDDRFYDVDLPVGVYAALSRWGANQLHYLCESVNGTLIVPLGAPLPTLQARAAALCSGIAPARRGRTLAYRNVPQLIAERIARSLDQTLQTTEVGSRASRSKLTQ
jgi:hypothetical protein